MFNIKKVLLNIALVKKKNINQVSRRVSRSRRKKMFIVAEMNFHYGVTQKAQCFDILMYAHSTSDIE